MRMIVLEHLFALAKQKIENSAVPVDLVDSENAVKNTRLRTIFSYVSFR